jgi:hypothetical protein
MCGRDFGCRGRFIGCGFWGGRGWSRLESGRRGEGAGGMGAVKVNGRVREEMVDDSARSRGWGVARDMMRCISM